MRAISVIMLIDQTANKSVNQLQFKGKGNLLPEQSLFMGRIRNKLLKQFQFKPEQKGENYKIE